MVSLWELLGASPEGAATLDARTGALAGSYGRSAFDALTLPAREIAGNFVSAASRNNQEYQNAMQGWRYADPPPGVKVVELDGAPYWQTPDGRYTEPQRVNIAGALPVGKNEQTGAVSMETGRLLPLTQGYMSSELGTSLSAPRGALGAGAGRVADKGAASLDEQMATAFKNNNTVRGAELLKRKMAEIGLGNPSVHYAKTGTTYVYGTAPNKDLIELRIATHPRMANPAGYVTEKASGAMPPVWGERSVNAGGMPMRKFDILTGTDDLASMVEKFISDISRR